MMEVVAALGVSKKEINSVELIPNPANSNLTINSNQQISKISIHNILGQKALKFRPNTTTFSETLDVSNLPSGLYIVTVRQVNGGVLNERLIINDN